MALVALRVLPRLTVEPVARQLLTTLAVTLVLVAQVALVGITVMCSLTEAMAVAMAIVLLMAAIPVTLDLVATEPVEMVEMVEMAQLHLTVTA